MVIVNTDHVEGRNGAAEHRLVIGKAIRSENVGGDVGAGLENLVDGELRSCAAVLNEARREALRADAVINVRFTTPRTAGGAAELPAHGTAVSSS